MSHLHQEQSKSFYLVGYLVSKKVRKKNKLGFFVSLLYNFWYFCNFTDADDSDDKDDDDDDVRLYKKKKRKIQKMPILKV